MAEFRITFGQRYRSEQHPQPIGGVYPHPDGWGTIVAENAEAARRIAFEAFFDRFCFVYPAEDFNPEYYRLGELFRLPLEGKNE